jgi:(S)-citramalyl-CoA lyase
MSSVANSQLAIRTRSWMFTPATRPDRFANAAKSQVDVLIVDLEDAVQPDEKAAARGNVRTLLDAADNTALPPLAIRINSLLTRFGLDDLIMLLDAKHAPQFVLLPKIESPEQVLQIDTLLTAAGKTTWLVPMIESARGLSVVEPIAQSCSRVAALMFGAADYASDVKAQPEALALQLARCGIAAACAQAGVLAIDTPCFALHDASRLQADLTFAAANGFEAKAAIHPSHIDSINTTFTPSAERVTWAKRVVEAAEKGAGTVDGRMVDEAISREARRVLAAA